MLWSPSPLCLETGNFRGQRHTQVGNPRSRLIWEVGRRFLQRPTPLEPPGSSQHGQCQERRLTHLLPSAPEGNNFKTRTMKSKALMEEQGKTGERVEQGLEQRWRVGRISEQGQSIDAVSHMLNPIPTPASSFHIALCSGVKAVCDRLFWELWEDIFFLKDEANQLQKVKIRHTLLF